MRNELLKAFFMVSVLAVLITPIVLEQRIFDNRSHEDIVMFLEQAKAAGMPQKQVDIIRNFELSQAQNIHLLFGLLFNAVTFIWMVGMIVYHNLTKPKSDTNPQ